MSRTRRPAARQQARRDPSDFGGLIATYGTDEVGGEGRLRRGQQAMARARLQLFLGNAHEAESVARRALADFAGAMNWLEDTPEFEVAHHRLDEAGRWVREMFGCWLEREDTTYARTCPADLAHNRIGLSPGMRNLVRECSVCGLDPRLCRHVTGKAYNAPRRLIGDRCNLCGLATCQHVDGEVGPVFCYHLITEVGTLDEVSLVSRPAQPMARLSRVTVPLADLTAELGPRGWVRGMDVSCDRCLTACHGVREVKPSDAVGT
ncbi:MAG: hypothetical protein ACT4PI_14170 [Actinomycetota bacterium]